MRNTPNVKAERFRVQGPPRSNNGAFQMDHLRIVVSDGMGWDHVSVSTPNRVPTYAEMCGVKELFFKDDECAMQLHVPKADHVNFHPFCLHLWRPQIQSEIDAIKREWWASGEPISDNWSSPGEIPRPPSILVGPSRIVS